ncbi:hypothetical protein D9M70_617290 [compost metagenome]
MALMKPLRTGCTRAAALAWWILAAGSAGSGLSRLISIGFICPGKGRGFAISTTRTGAGGLMVCTAGAASS